VVEDDERGDRPISIRTDVNIAAVANLVKNERRIASRIREESLNIPKTVVLRILKEDFFWGEGGGGGKLCTRFVPHSLTPDQRVDRVTSCQDIIAMTDVDKNFLTWICLTAWDK
jgi:hypothetical protein